MRPKFYQANGNRGKSAFKYNYAIHFNTET